MIRRLCDSQDGTLAVEYALLTLTVAIAVLTSGLVFGSAVAGKFAGAGDPLSANRVRGVDLVVARSLDDDLAKGERAIDDPPPPAIRQNPSSAGGAAPLRDTSDRASPSLTGWRSLPAATVERD